MRDVSSDCPDDSKGRGDRTGFLPLPARGFTPPDDRRAGFEIEFGGLSPDEAVCTIRQELGGRAIEQAAGDWIIEDTEIGPLRLFLDSKYRPSGFGAFARTTVDIERIVVPLELVTEPLTRNAFDRVSATLARLADDGAEGSGDALLYGFGIHINIGLADPKGGTDVPTTLLAFALLEPWLRHRDPLDVSRRILPFADPLPRRLTESLVAAGSEVPADAVVALCAAHIRSRNYGLDVLPVLASVWPARFAAAFDMNESINPRPAWHYRMPESRIGRQDWSLAYEWNRWVLVERVASRPDLLVTLGEHWLRQISDGFIPHSGRYFAAVTKALGPLADLAPEMRP